MFVKSILINLGLKITLKKSIKIFCWFCLLVVLLYTSPISLIADQAQFFYDELGRLVGVVDGNGDVAVYNYDAVGNLLSIEQFTQGGSGIGVFVLAPGSALAGTDIEIGGFGFRAMLTDERQRIRT